MLIVCLLASLNLSVFADEHDIKGTLLFRQSSPIDRAQYVKELMILAYRNIGYQIAYISVPLKRSLIVSNQGMTDGEWIRIEGIEKDYTNLIPVPYVLFDFELDLLINDELCPACGIADIGSVAYVRGVVATEQALNKFQLAGRAIDLQNLATLLNFFKMGRTQAIIADRADFQESSLADMQVTHHKLMDVRDFHYLHKKNRHLVIPLANSLFRLEQDGTARKLREKYRFQPTGEQLPPPVQH